MDKLSVDKCKEILQAENTEATTEAAEQLMNTLIEYAEEIGELARYESTLNDKEQIEKEDIEKILRFTPLLSEDRKDSANGTT